MAKAISGSFCTFKSLNYIRFMRFWKKFFGKKEKPRFGLSDVESSVTKIEVAKMAAVYREMSESNVDSVYDSMIDEHQLRVMNKHKCETRNDLKLRIYAYNQTMGLNSRRLDDFFSRLKE